MQLHDYQLVARDFLRGQDRAALFLDMGLGKTAVSLAAIEPRHLPALVVAPKRVAENVWPVELGKWRPDLTMAVAAGSPTARANALASAADLVVIGRDNLRDVQRTDFQTVILDESSSYKSVSAARTKAARKLASPARHVWELTGTPTPNGYMDLFSQIRILDGGERLGTNITGFRNRYFRPGRQIANGTIVTWELREFSEHHIRALIEDICLYMESAGRIELPGFTVNPVAVELPAPARKAYNDMSRTMVADLEMLGGDIHSATNAAVLTDKLSQITAGFLYRDDHLGYHPLHLEKIRALEEIVESAQGSGVLVFYKYVAERDMLKQAVTYARTIEEPGVIAAWNRGEVPVLLAHPASAGHGLNLQDGGHTIVWTGPTWNLEHWEQGNARLHRQGQKHPVVSHVLLANRSIDHLIRAAVDDKADVQAELLDYLKSPI
jgi:SNF2 family DNA or RNA helicase